MGAGAQTILWQEATQLSITQWGFPSPLALSPVPWASWWRGRKGRGQAGCLTIEGPFPCCLLGASDLPVFPHIPNGTITNSLCGLGQVTSPL